MSDSLHTTSRNLINPTGGTAGAVIANRLSEVSTYQVLVLEAGYTNEGVIDSIIPVNTGQLSGSQWDWNYTTVPQTSAGGRVLTYPRGYILGGSSSISKFSRASQCPPSVYDVTDGMFYTRGAASDYNRWAEVTGDSGWSWSEILPYILKVCWIIYFLVLSLNRVIGRAMGLTCGQSRYHGTIQPILPQLKRTSQSQPNRVPSVQRSTCA